MRKAASSEVMFPDIFRGATWTSRENFTGELLRPHYFNRGRIRPISRKWRAKMAWKAPKIVEVPCGMEINMYVSATRK
jgi:coenzyme PQQ precursor peptide PqqA